MAAPGAAGVIAARGNEISPHWPLTFELIVPRCRNLDIQTRPYRHVRDHRLRQSNLELREMAVEGDLCAGIDPRDEGLSSTLNEQLLLKPNRAK